MEQEKKQAYEGLRHDSITDEHVYELCQFSATEERRAEEPKNIKKRELTTWNKPIIHTVLLSLIVILLVVILCLLLAHMSTRDTTCTAGATTGATTGAIAGNNGYPNFTQWANDIVSRVNQSLPDFNEWANGVVSKVNSNVTGNLPDFNEWANGVSQNTLQLFQNNTNFTELDKQILQTTRDSAQKLINIVNTLSNLQDTSTSTAGVVDDILLIAQELLVLHNDSTALPTSCKEIKERQPLSPSGYYILVALNGGAYETYCNMDELCGSGGGWTRLAYLDMSDATQNCPSGFRLYQSGGVRACGRTKTYASCVSVQFPSNGISYSQICGRVIGYQYGDTDSVRESVNNINSYYLDGVSITRGSPRQHVWTLYAGVSSDYNDNGDACPCAGGTSPQSFVGNNYFCESGTSNRYNFNGLFTSDPLWDGQGCRSLEWSCCNVPGLPWFHRDYGSTTTTDYIELRVCGDQGTDNDDAPVGYYEIYVK